MSFKVSFRLAPPQQQTNFSRFLHIIYSTHYILAHIVNLVLHDKFGSKINHIEHLTKQQLMKRSKMMYWSLQWPSCIAMYMYTIKLVVMQRRYIHWLRVFKCTWKINWNDAHRVYCTMGGSTFRMNKFLFYKPAFSFF